MPVDTCEESVHNNDDEGCNNEMGSTLSKSGGDELAEKKGNKMLSDPALPEKETVLRAGTEDLNGNDNAVETERSDDTVDESVEDDNLNSSRETSGGENGDEDGTSCDRDKEMEVVESELMDGVGEEAANQNSVDEEGMVVELDSSANESAQETPQDDVEKESPGQNSQSEEQGMNQSSDKENQMDTDESPEHVGDKGGNTENESDKELDVSLEQSTEKGNLMDAHETVGEQTGNTELESDKGVEVSLEASTKEEKVVTKDETKSNSAPSENKSEDSVQKMSNDECEEKSGQTGDEKPSSKSESGDTDGKEKEKDEDSDDDRPLVFIRNLMDITEKDSDDDEDIQEIVVEPTALSVCRETSTPQLKTYSRRDAAIKRLAETTTTNEDEADVVMVFESDSNEERKHVDKKLGKACAIMSRWLTRQTTKPNTPAVLQTTRPATQDSSRVPPLATNARDSAPTVLSNMLQSVQQTYNPPPLTTPQVLFGRGPAGRPRKQQSIPQMSIVGTSTTFTPGTTFVSQPNLNLWQPHNQIVHRQNAPVVHGRDNTTSVQASSVPRASTVGNQPFTHLIFDPTTGYLLCPTNQTSSGPIISQQPQVLQQPSVIQQQVQQQPQRQTANSNATIRIQNGMIIRPGDPSYNNVRHAVGNRSSLEISLTNAPTSNQQQQRMQLHQQLPVSTVRHYAPRQQVASRYTRPQNQTYPLQNLMAQQAQQNMNQVQMTPRAAPMRFQSIRPSPPQTQRPPVPIRSATPPSQRASIRQPAPVGSAPKTNGIPIPIPLPIRTPGQPAGPRPMELANVTAGNQKPMPGTVEETDQDLQNKTFPSLVVQVRTCLQSKPNRQMQTKARSDLDASVKTVLVHSPTKFTEWLMRRGMLKLAHNCDVHTNTPFKLGMYSDAGRQPFSGGYVWTSDCCPDRQVSVFNGSIFEGSKYPPGTVLKLMYHWACQTPANNVLQWVKVSSLYLKNFFTLLRAVCISWMHEQCPPMGGESKYVEIGVITLGSSAETSRGVKNVNVEILGVFDPATKIVRMKVINSFQGQLFKDKNNVPGAKPDAYEQGARAFQILWPLTHWVDKRSILLVDGIIDKALFQELGFKNIQQCSEMQRNVTSNVNVMNYLRNLVPKMFSSTLSVLSKSIVQQFLDELSWREMYGQTPYSCFENLLDHISQMTKWELQGESLITRLNKINQNPFIDWSYTKQTRRCPLNTVPLSLRNEAGIRECVRLVMKDEKKQPPPPPVYIPPASTPALTPPASAGYTRPPKPAQKRKNVDTRDISANIAYYRSHLDATPKIHSLQSYYYGSVRADDSVTLLSQRFPQNLKCPMCTRTFTSNVEICRHIYTHISSVTYRGSENSVCRICLKELPIGVNMNQHMQIAHTMSGCISACRICEEKFKTEQELVIHMWDLHQRRETPYKCGICKYASSFHHSVVQHHQEKHGVESDVMCPFCLKMFSCANVAQLKMLINHLQAHASLQRRLKKCPRCVLTFVSDLDLEVHLHDHVSQEPSAKWIPYLLPPNEFNVKMGMPPPSKTPLQFSMASATAAALASVSVAQPPPKKQKLAPYPAKKKPSTLNATLAVPIDTNEKFGGSRYRIVLQSSAKGVCAECNEDITKPNHFIGKLSCSKCRFSTACQAAMDLHHEKNHKNGSKKVIPGIKTKKISVLKEPMACKCGFSSTHPNKLANHLISCDRMTAYPLVRTPVTPTVSESEPPRPKSPVTQQAASSVPIPDLPLPPVSLSPTLGLLGGEPVTNFDDMLSFEESMASLEALALPPLLSPSATMPHSPSVFAPAESSTSSQAASQAHSSGNVNNNTEAANSSWDPDAWGIPGLIAKCKGYNVI